MPSYPILYSFRRCPYAMRARLALSISGQVCELREVVLRDKPPELLAISPKGTVPVLVVGDGSVLEESLEIMIWALQKKDPQGWLRPDHESMAMMQALIGECDGGFKYHLDRYKYPQRYAGVDAQEHRGQGSQFLAQLNTQLETTPYLFGDRVSLADRAIAPFVRQFASCDRSWFNQQPWPKLQDWLTTFLDSEGFQQIMQKYPKWESGAVGSLFPPS
ncbi:MAG: glutathione S-transferase [Acaryochloris sp. RU_4_1]|nr:glutathione S-transferase [Acaryochloris sp. RU_4_1]NJR55156.1 glutathione S-transferase [Acaryochloris sp. CRU_2_0]